MIYLPLAYDSFKLNAVPGSSVATMPRFARSAIPLSEAWSRWSAETAPSSAASSVPPSGKISSAWIFNFNPSS